MCLYGLIFNRFSLNHLPFCMNTRHLKLVPGLKTTDIKLKYNNKRLVLQFCPLWGHPGFAAAKTYILSQPSNLMKNHVLPYASTGNRKPIP